MVLVAIYHEEGNYTRHDHLTKVLRDSNMQFLDWCQDTTMSELDCYKDILKKAKEVDPKSHCIIIKDNSVTTISGNGLEEIIKRVIRYKFDFCYLANWGDYCQLHVKLEKRNPMSSVSIVKTQHPMGNQCIVFSPSGRDIMLGSNMANGASMNLNNVMLCNTLTEEIYTGNVSAITTVPPVFEYDISLNAIRNSDYSKMNLCAPVSLPEDTKTSSSSNLLRFVIVAILAILVAWAIVKLGPRSVSTKTTKIR